MKPSVPAGLGLLWNQKPLVVVGILDPAASVLVGVLEVLIVAVSKAVGADEAHDLISITGLLMSALIWFTS